MRSHQRHRAIAPPPPAVVQSTARRQYDDLMNEIVRVPGGALKTPTRSPYDKSFLVVRDGAQAAPGGTSNASAAPPSILPLRFSKTGLATDAVHDPVRMLVQNDILEATYWKMKGLDVATKHVLDELYREQEQNIIAANESTWLQKMESVCNCDLTVMLDVTLTVTRNTHSRTHCNGTPNSCPTSSLLAGKGRPQPHRRWIFSQRTW